MLFFNIITYKIHLGIPIKLIRLLYLKIILDNAKIKVYNFINRFFDFCLLSFSIIGVFNERFKTFLSLFLFLILQRNDNKKAMISC